MDRVYFGMVCGTVWDVQYCPLVMWPGMWDSVGCMYLVWDVPCCSVIEDGGEPLAIVACTCMVTGAVWDVLPCPAVQVERWTAFAAWYLRQFGMYHTVPCLLSFQIVCKVVYKY